MALLPLLQEALAQEQVALEQEGEVVLLDLLDSQDLSCWSDLFGSSGKCFEFLPMVLPLAARKDLDKTKFAAEL